MERGRKRKGKRVSPERRRDSEDPPLKPVLRKRISATTRGRERERERGEGKKRTGG